MSPAPISPGKRSAAVKTPAGAWTRIDASARLAAADLGLEAPPETLADADKRAALVRRLAGIVVDQVL
ncbi:MAG: hypothetical protein AAB339_03650, partial [Elusimicrobiota bacterium]